jgi:hypothetical protein
MAICGGYMSVLFGLCVGFGASLLKETWNRNGIEFDMLIKEKWLDNNLDTCVVFLFLGVLVLTFVWGMVNNLSYGRSFATIVIVVYGVFFLCASGFAITKAADGY